MTNKIAMVSKKKKKIKVKNVEKRPLYVEKKPIVCGITQAKMFFPGRDYTKHLYMSEEFSDGTKQAAI